MNEIIKEQMIKLDEIRSILSLEADNETDRGKELKLYDAVQMIKLSIMSLEKLGGE